MIFLSEKRKSCREGKKGGLTEKRTFGKKVFMIVAFVFGKDSRMETLVWARESLYWSDLALMSGAFADTRAGSRWVRCRKRVAALISKSKCLSDVNRLSFITVILAYHYILWFRANFRDDQKSPSANQHE